MSLPSTFTATLTLEGHAYQVEYEYEAPEPDVGLMGGWNPIGFTDASGVEVDEDTVLARESSSGHELSLDALNDLLIELATANEPSFDGPDEPDYCDDEVGYDPYAGGYSADC